MIEIICGTDRPGSNTRKITDLVADLYRQQGEVIQILDLRELQLAEVASGEYYKGAPGSYGQAVERVTKADGVVVVAPEYNGSFPGALKLFIDYWKYPKTFEYRPFALIGLGNRWGGLRAVEHLQQVFAYRSGFVFPHRVFIPNVKDVLKTGKIEDPFLRELLETQTRDFIKYVRALRNQGLDANSRP